MTNKYCSINTDPSTEHCHVTTGNA